MQLSLMDLSLSISRPPPNKFTFLEHDNIRTLFSLLPPKTVVLIWSLLLNEAKVVLVSSQQSVLLPIAEAILSLMFPFHWQGVYIPVLPKAMMGVLQAPVPFFVGVVRKPSKDSEESGGGGGSERHVAAARVDEEEDDDDEDDGYDEYDYEDEDLPFGPEIPNPPGVVFVDVDKGSVLLGSCELDPEEPREAPHIPERELFKMMKSLHEYTGIDPEATGEDANETEGQSNTGSYDADESKRHSVGDAVSRMMSPSQRHHKKRPQSTTGRILQNW